MRIYLTVLAALFAIVFQMGAPARADTAALECVQTGGGLPGSYFSCQSMACQPPLSLLIDLTSSTVTMSGGNYRQGDEPFDVAISGSSMRWIAADWLFELNRFSGNLHVTAAKAGMIDFVYDWQCSRAERQF